MSREEVQAANSLLQKGGGGGAGGVNREGENY